ncbi:hypothetical protein WDJ51_12560 [Rathayibacter sp. YIM 133350]|uniref:hypothetical protein n=1 Tax=Rathayibacter sp. YIM 133350 TaxID=3131992 RepID=UPI00307CD037
MLFIVALALTIGTVVLHQLTTLVDLSPFNNIHGASPRERRTEALVNGPLMALPAVLVGVAWSTGVAALGYAAAGLELAFALSGLALWWLPYLAGRSVPWATMGGESWESLHARTYASTIIVLPEHRGRPRPNLEHMILHTLMLLSAAACLLFALTL